MAEQNMDLLYQRYVRYTYGPKMTREEFQKAQEERLAKETAAEAERKRVNLATAVMWAKDMRTCPGFTRIRRYGLKVHCLLDTFLVPIKYRGILIGHVDLAGVELVHDAGHRNYYEQPSFNPTKKYPLREEDVCLGSIHRGGRYYKTAYDWWICLGHQDSAVRPHITKPEGIICFTQMILSYLKRCPANLSWNTQTNSIAQPRGRIIPLKDYPPSVPAPLVTHLRNEYAAYLKELEEKEAKENKNGSRKTKATTPKRDGSRSADDRQEVGG